MRLPSNSGWPLFALLFTLLFTQSPGSAQIFNPAIDFEKGWQTHSNPNGVWSYGYSASFTTPVTLYDQTIQNGINGPNAQYWLSSSVDIANSPSAEFNDGPAFNDGNVNFLAHEFLLVSGIGGQYSDLVFTAPASGSYSIVSAFRGAQFGIGVFVGVVVNGNVIFSSSVTSEGQIVRFKTNVALQAGNTVVFSVGPNGGLQNTGLALQICEGPCLTPTAATYAKQPVGTTSAPKTFTLTNNLPVDLTAIAISTTGDFAVSATTCTTTLAINKKCTISVTFTPTQTGKRTGKLIVSDSAPNSPQTASLKGAGE